MQASQLPPSGASVSQNQMDTSSDSKAILNDPRQLLPSPYGDLAASNVPEMRMDGSRRLWPVPPRPATFYFEYDKIQTVLDKFRVALLASLPLLVPELQKQQIWKQVLAAVTSWAQPGLPSLAQLAQQVLHGVRITVPNVPRERKWPSQGCDPAKRCSLQPPESRREKRDPPAKAGEKKLPPRERSTRMTKPVKKEMDAIAQAPSKPIVQGGRPIDEHAQKAPKKARSGASAPVPRVRSVLGWKGYQVEIVEDDGTVRTLPKDEFDKHEQRQQLQKQQAARVVTSCWQQQPRH